MAAKGQYQEDLLNIFSSKLADIEKELAMLKEKERTEEGNPTASI